MAAVRRRGFDLGMSAAGRGIEGDVGWRQLAGRLSSMLEGNSSLYMNFKKSPKRAGWRSGSLMNMTSSDREAISFSCLSNAASSPPVYENLRFLFAIFSVRITLRRAISLRK